MRGFLEYMSTKLPLQENCYLNADKMWLEMQHPFSLIFSKATNGTEKVRYKDGNGKVFTYLSRLPLLHCCVHLFY